LTSTVSRTQSGFVMRISDVCIADRATGSLN
jgi:hypothetical protein